MTILRSPQIFWGGVYVSALSSAVSIESEVETQDATNFASQGTRNMAASFINNAASFEGQVYADTYEKLDLLTQDTNNIQPFTVAVENYEGAVAYSVLAHQQSFSHGGTVGELVNLSVGMFTQGKCKRGIMAFNREIDSSDVGAGFRLEKIKAGDEIEVISHVHDIESGIRLTLELSDTSDFSNIVDSVDVMDQATVGSAIVKVTSTIAQPYARITAYANLSADAAVFLFQ